MKEQSLVDRDECASVKAEISKLMLVGFKNIDMKLHRFNMKFYFIKVLPFISLFLILLSLIIASGDYDLNKSGGFVSKILIAIAKNTPENMIYVFVALGIIGFSVYFYNVAFGLDKKTEKKLILEQLKSVTSSQVYKILLKTNPINAHHILWEAGLYASQNDKKLFQYLSSQDVVLNVAVQKLVHMNFEKYYDLIESGDVKGKAEKLNIFKTPQLVQS